MKTDGPLRLATRGSTLAQRQTAAVQDRLADRRHSVEQVIIETTGDQIRDELIHQLGKTGAFVRALDEAVLEGEADAAVHSMKDMPTEQPSSLIIAGVPPRAAAGDVLVTPDGDSLEELPAGAVVGTASTRRRAQVYAERSDIEVAPLRGNVDTRVEKLLAPSLQREHERRMEAEEKTTSRERETMRQRQHMRKQLMSGSTAFQSSSDGRSNVPSRLSTMRLFLPRPGSLVRTS